MNSHDRVMAALDHREPDRVPLFAPNVMDTRAPYDPRVTQFLGTSVFDRLVDLGGLTHHPSDRTLGRRPQPSELRARS